MIKVCINTYGDCGHVEYCVEMETTAEWARTPQETVVGLLFEGAEQVSRALQVDRPGAGEQPETLCYVVGAGGIECVKPAGHVLTGDKWHRSRDYGAGTTTWADKPEPGMGDGEAGTVSCGDTRNLPNGDGRRVVCRKPFGHVDRGDLQHRSKDHGYGAFTWADDTEVTRTYETDSLELARVLAKGRES